MRQKFEVVGVDLFGPITPYSDSLRWNFIVEDAASRLVELFKLRDATAERCATTLLEAVTVWNPETPYQ